MTNVDGLGEHYDKCNESDMERQIPYALTDMWNLKDKQTKTKTKPHTHKLIENQLVIARGRRGE